MKNRAKAFGTVIDFSSPFCKGGSRGISSCKDKFPLTPLCKRGGFKFTFFCVTYLKALVLLYALTLCGCVYQTADIKTPSFDEQIPAQKANYESGSIWQAASSGLAEDFKARSRGDIVTVLISEQASASKQASTGTKRESNVNAGIPNLMGLENSGLVSSLDLANLLKASYGSKYDGSGSTSRNENLRATITAKVVDVLPNGNLLIKGQRNVKVNNEDQVIVLEGTVRPRDIGPDNVVNSIYVADAKISYTGNGVLSDRQRPGWLLNILEKIWPF